MEDCIQVWNQHVRLIRLTDCAVKVTMRDWINAGLRPVRDENVANKRLVRIFAGLLQKRWQPECIAVKVGNVSLNIASFRRYREIRALNGFLVTQRQITSKDVWVLYNNVRKLHRPRMLKAFLADTVDTIWLWQVSLDRLIEMRSWRAADDSLR